MGLGKSNGSWCRSPLGTGRVGGRHQRVPKLLDRFCFLQQSQFTSLSQSSPPPCRLCRPPGEGSGQGATMLRKRLCCRAQPLNSATFREPRTCFKGLLFTLESSSDNAEPAHPECQRAPSGAAGLLVVPSEGWTGTLCGASQILGWRWQRPGCSPWPAQPLQLAVHSGPLWLPGVPWQCWGGGGGGCVES